MSSYSAGLSLLQVFAREGYNRFNLRITTIFDLAWEVCGRSLFQNGIELPENSTYIVFEILRTLSKQGKLKYFKDLRITPSLSGAVFYAISELKTAGISPEDLTPDKFVDPKKGEDFKLIFTRYEEILKHTKRIDASGLLTLATDIVKAANPFKSQIFIIPSNLELSPKEMLFVDTIINHAEIFQLPKPFGLEQPESRLDLRCVNQNEGAERPFSMDCAYFGNIRTSIPETSGQRFGIIRTAFRQIRTPCRVSSLTATL